MKSGLERIAEARQNIPHEKLTIEVPKSLHGAMCRLEYVSSPDKIEVIIDELAEAGARIAAEIDRLNDLKQDRDAKNSI